MATEKTIWDEICECVRLAGTQTDRVEERAIALLHGRGWLAGMTCEEIRGAEADVRLAILTLIA